MRAKIFRPPWRSVMMPAGSRQIAPFSTATAVIHASCTSESPNSLRMGIPRTPNISHTANMRVKAMVEMTRTLTFPGSSVAPTRGTAVTVGAVMVLAPSGGDGCRLHLLITAANIDPGFIPTFVFMW